VYAHNASIINHRTDAIEIADRRNRRIRDRCNRDLKRKRRDLDLDLADDESSESGKNANDKNEDTISHYAKQDD